MKPRVTSSISVTPVTCSDLLAPVIFGIEPRPYREFLRAENVRHVRLGQRLIARVEDVLAAFDRLAARQQGQADAAASVDAVGGRDDQVDGPAPVGESAGARLLRRLGRTRGGGVR